MLQNLSPECEEARRRVMRHGRAAMVYSILNPGIHHWFDEPTDGVAGFVRRGSWWVIAGDPVCDEADLPGFIQRLERAAAAEGRKVVYCVNTEAMRRAAQRVGKHASVILGAEPVWNPAGWADRVKRLSSLRAQLNRSRNKGVTIEAIPIADVPKLRPHLTGVINDWLAHRPLPPLRFLVEPMAIDGVLTDRQLYVAHQHGKPVAFLLASPVPQRNGWIVEQICRRHDAPNGTAELLIDFAMRRWAETGFTYATLGLVILTPLAGQSTEPDPWWLRATFAFARLHGRRFYNFDGLERFRVKMQPDAWEPISLITAAKTIGPYALAAAGGAFCGRRTLFGLLSGGVLTAILTELQTLRRYFISLH